MLSTTRNLACAVFLCLSSKNHCDPSSHWEGSSFHVLHLVYKAQSRAGSCAWCHQRGWVQVPLLPLPAPLHWLDIIVKRGLGIAAPQQRFKKILTGFGKLARMCWWGFRGLSYLCWKETFLTFSGHKPIRTTSERLLSKQKGGNKLKKDYFPFLTRNTFICL